ncbi:MAG: hypothetical protein HKN47_01055, partial [Pirellulaceae bacterium]|nr:hypothetical protein [Pirellulaceae bacterium]
ARIATQPTGQHQVDLKWRDLSPTFNTRNFSPVAFDVQTTTSGTVNWTIAADAIERLDQHRGTAQIEFEQIQIAGSDIGTLSSEIKAAPRQFEVDAHGEIFGGTLAISTVTDITPETTWWRLLDTSTTSNLSLDSMQLQKMIAVIPPPLAPAIAKRRWQGNLTADVEIQNNSGNRESMIEFNLDDLTLDGLLLTRRVGVVARLSGNTLSIDQVTGSYAGGRVDANGRWSLDSGIGQVNVRLSSVNASKFFLPISTTTAEQLDGRLSARLGLYTGTSDRISARGSVEISDGRAYGLPVTSAHSDITAWLSTRMDRWHVAMPTIAGQTGNGRVTGSLQFDSAYQLTKFDMRSHWKADRVDFTKLLYEAQGSTTSLASGRLSGKLTLNGDNVATVNDLSGNFDFELDGSSGQSIPGLTDAQNYLGSIALAGVRFEEGTVRGNIGGGRAQVKEFQLSSPQAMVWAEGNMQLASQTLDMEAVISTGNFQTNPLVTSSLQFALATYAAPVSVLIEINQLLSNRTIFVDVRGPANDPRLRLKPLASIREEAARFLLQQLLPIPCELNQNRNPLSQNSFR